MCAKSKVSQQLADYNKLHHRLAKKVIINFWMTIYFVAMAIQYTCTTVYAKRSGLITNGEISLHN